MCSVQDRANHVASRETNLKLWKASRDDISQALRNSAKPMPKMSSGGPKTHLQKKEKFVEIIKLIYFDVASSSEYLYE